MDYSELTIYSQKVSTPYFINNIERYFYGGMRKVGISEKKIAQFHKLYKNSKILFAWYRGKGTPEEIILATKTISNKVGLPLNHASKEVIREFMQLYGIGVDCSGFVYEVLRLSFNKVGEEKKFTESLNWKNGKIGASRAGVFVFSGRASIKVEPKNIQPLDLILEKDGSGKYDHMAIILRENSKLIIAQSSIGKSPFGINISRFSIKKGLPIFEYQPEIGNNWEKLYRMGLLEFRRLKILTDL